MERKIVILDGYASNPGDLSWSELEKMGHLVVYDRTKPDEVVERVGDATIVLTNKVTFDAALFRQLPRLKYIGVLATGFNIIDVDAAREAGVIVSNIPAYSTDSVAQTAFAHILNITNRVGHYTQQARDGKWSWAPDYCYWDTPLLELAGMTMGIVGLGNIGSRVAQIAHTFGMDVFAFTSRPRDNMPVGVQKATFEGLLSVSDILSLHCPLNESTRHLINAETLSLMKPGAILINTGRGPLVDEQAVAEALQCGQLRAYGADVMEQEPPRQDNPLFRCPNAFFTPHIAWATHAARGRLVQIAIDNVRAYLDGKPQNVVNAEPEINKN